MKRIRAFIEKETILTVTALCAAISAGIVPPSPEYADYFNWPVLALLFCLMAVVAGLQKTCVFQKFSQIMLFKTSHVKSVAMILVMMCFFLSMLITNDVALITFVPLTIELFEPDNEDTLIFIIVMETVAANLGSLITPIGNPQNLYIFSMYHIKIGAFLRITLPLGAAGLALIATIMLCMRGESTHLPCQKERVEVDRANALMYLFLFVLCILTVLKLVAPWICFGIVLTFLLLSDRSVLQSVDYGLLLTFLCFFIFSGNIARIPIVNDWISKLISGHELIAAALISQVISNVPTAVMLSSFTNDFKALLIGVDIGGLGTLVASLASVISYKLYSARSGAKQGRYLAVFSTVNAAVFTILLTMALWIL